MKSLKQALGEQQQSSEEAQASALVPQQQANYCVEQLSKALEAKDMTLASIKVLGNVLEYSTPQRSRLLVCMSRLGIRKGTTKVCT